MAITPHEAGKVTEDELQAVSAAEKKLDALLRKNFWGSEKVRVTDPISALNTRCRKELLRRYRAANWVVEEKYNKGDPHPMVRNSDAGTYWFFSPQKPIDTSFANQINNPAPPPWREDGPINPNWR